MEFFNLFSKTGLQGKMMETWRETFVERIRIENTIIRECLAEFIGTFFFVVIDFHNINL